MPYTRKFSSNAQFTEIQSEQSCDVIFSRISFYYSKLHVRLRAREFCRRNVKIFSRQLQKKRNDNTSDSRSFFKSDATTIYIVNQIHIFEKRHEYFITLKNFN